MFNYYLYEVLVKPREQLNDWRNKQTIRDSAPASATNFANNCHSLLVRRQLQLPERLEGVPFAKQCPSLLSASSQPSVQEQRRTPAKRPINSNDEKRGANGLECNNRSIKVE